MLETELQDQFRVVATETARVVASVRDHLQVELPQVWVCVRPPVAEELVSEVARAVGQEVRLLLWRRRRPRVSRRPSASRSSGSGRLWPGC